MWRTFVTGECDRCHTDSGLALLHHRDPHGWLCRPCLRAVYAAGGE